ncbi:hypothetical protein ACFOY8_14040 [Thalassospira xianhensis]|uniref:Serine protease n=1 Tax=Thalassospira xianhensis MCCC 1A02616 TaxID=1177929 RepID=A0A367UI72_9PROT|nr:hypothetical protein [Thalassospira xianhensis]RCK07720.1 hypothetical protein TH5_01230 [Thalassospira xianhensis MCCC 1A02616]
MEKVDEAIDALRKLVSSHVAAVVTHLPDGRKEFRCFATLVARNVYAMGHGVFANSNVIYMAYRNLHLHSVGPDGQISNDGVRVSTVYRAPLGEVSLLSPVSKVAESFDLPHASMTWFASSRNAALSVPFFSSAVERELDSIQFQTVVCGFVLGDFSEFQVSLPRDASRTTHVREFTLAGFAADCGYLSSQDVGMPAFTENNQVAGVLVGCEVGAEQKIGVFLPMSFLSPLVEYFNSVRLSTRYDQSSPSTRFFAPEYEF